MSHIAIGRYGAIELKMAYQRNMTLAMILVMTLTAAIIGVMYLLMETASAVVIVPERDPIAIRADLAPLPNIVKPRPMIDANAAKRNRPVVSSNLIPIDDDEFVEYDGGMLPTREELYQIIDAGRFGESAVSGNIVIDTGIDPYEEQPPAFTVCEIRPELIYEAKPVYPRQARMVGLEASVWVWIQVGTDGKPLNAKINVSSGSKAGFDEAALEAAMKCRFKPGIQNGIPVKVWVSLKFVFDLND